MKEYKKILSKIEVFHFVFWSLILLLKIEKLIGIIIIPSNMSFVISIITFLYGLSCIAYVIFFICEKRNQFKPTKIQWLLFIISLIGSLFIILFLVLGALDYMRISGTYPGIGFISPRNFRFCEA